MQYLLTAYDGTDDEAADRRIAARKGHLALGDELVAAGNMLYGTAILDDSGRMIGSMLVLDFPDRAAVDEWLRREPYVVGEVWKQVDIRPCRVGPSFVGLHG